LNWIKQHFIFHDKKHIKETGITEVETLLTNLTMDRNVAASHQNHTINAIMFIYWELLQFVGIIKQTLF
jgi:hypothetical protein